jgi:hypothetical protein
MHREWKEICMGLKRRHVGLWLSLILLSGSALSADLTGEWKGKVSVPDGTVIYQTFEFKLVNGVLSGTLTSLGFGPGPETMKLSDLKVEGSRITCTATRKDTGGVGPDTIDFDGVLNPAENQINFKMIVSMPNGNQAVNTLLLDRARSPDSTRPTG